MAAYLAFWAAAIPFVLRALSRALASAAAGSGTPPAQPSPDAVTHAPAPDPGHDPAHDRAEAIVRERYAAGDTDDVELHHRLRVLRSESADD